MGVHYKRGHQAGRLFFVNNLQRIFVARKLGHDLAVLRLVDIASGLSGGRVMRGMGATGTVIVAVIRRLAAALSQQDHTANRNEGQCGVNRFFHVAFLSVNNEV